MKYTLPQKSEKKNFIFNMFGSGVNAATSVLLLMIVSHILGDELSGIYSLGFSTSQLMYTIGHLEVRNVQITDTKRSFDFADVFFTRLCTVGIMILASIGFAIFKGYTETKLAVVLLLCLFMAMQALSDVFQGVLHLNGYLSLSGLSVGCPTCIGMILFFFTLLFTKNIVLGTVVQVLTMGVWILFFDIPYAKNFAKILPKFNLKKQKIILSCAIPLFLASFLHQYIFNAPKYAIDDLLISGNGLINETTQALYGYLVMPAAFINLLSLFVFRPQLVALSENWNNGEKKIFSKKVLTLYLWVVAFSVLAVGAGWFLGTQVLGIMYSSDLSAYKLVLVLLLLAGGFSAACTLTLTMLTVMRTQRFALIGYGITFISSLFIPKMLTSVMGLTGAAISYMLEMAILFITLIIIYILSFNREKTKE